MPAPDSPPARPTSVSSTFRSKGSWTRQTERQRQQDWLSRLAELKAAIRALG